MSQFQHRIKFPIIVISLFILLLVLISSPQIGSAQTAPEHPVPVITPTIVSREIPENQDNAGNTTAPDATTVTWIAPVGNTGSYNVSGQTIQLEVTTTSTAPIFGILYERWDAINEEWVYIGESLGSPHDINFDTNTLPPPTVNFDAWPHTGTAPLTVAFHNISTGYYTDCLWDYGNGESGNYCEAYHNYTYNSAGVYTARLTVSSPFGSDTKTITNYTTVSEAPPSTPTLYNIANSDEDDNYTMSWSSVSGATSYTLQEKF